MVNLKISLKKGFYVFIMGGFTALAGFLVETPWAPDQALYAGLGVAVLRVIQDALKHWDD